MKYAHIEEKTNRVIGWYADDIHGIWAEPVYEKKVIHEEIKDDDGNIVQNVVFEDVLVKDGFYDVSNIPTPNIEVSDEEWQKALSINANCYENSKFVVKDFRTIEEIEAEKLKQFQIQFRYDRDSLLAKTDIEINKAEDLGQDTKDLRVYRQALRDSTKDWIMPKELF